MHFAVPRVFSLINFISASSPSLLLLLLLLLLSLFALSLPSRGRVNSFFPATALTTNSTSRLCTRVMMTTLGLTMQPSLPGLALASTDWNVGLNPSFFFSTADAAAAGDVVVVVAVAAAAVADDDDDGDDTAVAALASSMPWGAFHDAEEGKWAVPSTLNLS